VITAISKGMQAGKLWWWCAYIIVHLNNTALSVVEGYEEDYMEDQREDDISD